MNNLLKIRKFLGLTQKQLADLLVVGQNTISQIENDKISLTDKNKFILVEKLNVNLDWLENNRGEIICDYEIAQAQLPQNRLPQHAETIIGRSSAAAGVPFINIPIANGTIEKNIEETDPKIECKIDVLPLGEISFFRPFYGESMAPKIKPADIIACKRDLHHKTILFGEVYLCIAKLNNQIIEYVRVIRRHDDPKLIILRPINNEFDDIIISINDIVELYIIKGVISKFM